MGIIESPNLFFLWKLKKSIPKLFFLYRYPLREPLYSLLSNHFFLPILFTPKMSKPGNSPDYFPLFQGI